MVDQKTSHYDIVTHNGKKRVKPFASHFRADTEKW